VAGAIFELMLIVAMMGASVFMLLPQPKLDVNPLTSERLGPVICVAMFHGDFIQVGVGALFIVVLYQMLRIDVRQVKVSIILLYTVPALLIFLALTGRFAGVRADSRSR
jgi:hypothetical protein